MQDSTDKEHSIEHLQQLGLKEYEAKSFVALARRPDGTAKEISESSEVPRTRVYDAIRVLESKGLVEIQHTSPQIFRAVSVDEAVETLRMEYDQRFESLRSALQGLEPVETDDETEITHEVWALSGDAGITTRTQQLINDADREVILIIGTASVATDALIERLQTAIDRGVTVTVGTTTESLRETIETSLPEAEVFRSGLEWLSNSELAGDDTEISRLLLVDKESILVSSLKDGNSGAHDHEQAVFGRGFDNGLVTIVRRLMATGVPRTDDDTGPT